jgi:lipopolysaccharide/colanic/teichoic acid biosynthesis glycosyltransferase
MNIAGLFATPSNRFEHTIRPRASRTLHSRESIEDVLRREHVRADRSARPFCCVLFRLHTGEGSGRAVQQLFRVADARARSTDEIGLFDPGTIFAVLPETDEPGAHCLAADILDLARESDLSPSVTIYVYGITPRPPQSGSRPRPAGHRRRHDAALSADSVPQSAERRIETSDRLSFPTFPLETLLCIPVPFWKRAIDITGAATALLVFFPLMLMIALVIKASEPRGSVFFRQRRAGLGAKPFGMFKFRTMYLDAEERKEALRSLSEQDGPAFKLKNDPRITPVGRILRRTSLDELPQLVNVLAGHMSLVGPRPPTFDEVAQYEQWYRRRLIVTPGITCLWQVEGRSRVTFEQWMRMDARYVQQNSIWNDLKLIARTIPAVLLGRGAS